MNDWQAVQHAALAGGPRRVGVPGGFERLVTRDRDERVQFGIELVDALEQRRRNLDGRVLTLLETLGKLRQCLVVQCVGHGSLNDFRHEVETMFDRWRVLLEIIAVIGLSDLIRAEPLRNVERMRHRHDVVGRCLR